MDASEAAGKVTRRIADEPDYRGLKTGSGLTAVSVFVLQPLRPSRRCTRSTSSPATRRTWPTAWTAASVSSSRRSAVLTSTASKWSVCPAVTHPSVPLSSCSVSVLSCLLLLCSAQIQQIWTLGDVWALIGSWFSRFQPTLPLFPLWGMMFLTGSVAAASGGGGGGVLSPAGQVAPLWNVWKRNHSAFFFVLGKKTVFLRLNCFSHFTSVFSCFRVASL